MRSGQLGYRLGCTGQSVLPRSNIQTLSPWHVVNTSTPICVSWFRPSGKAPTGPRASVSQDSSEYLSNYTPRAQQVLALARKEADRLHHHFVGTEHLLLGLIKLGEGTAVKVLQRMGLDLESVRMEVEKQVGIGPDQHKIPNIPYTPRVKKVLVLASKEARALNHTYVGTEHILLGLLREGDGVAARVLRSLDIDTEACRREVLRELDPGPTASVPESEPRDMSPAANMPKSAPDFIDISRRYDIYCCEGDRGTVVYRNALFKGRRRLLSPRERDVGLEFIELEQPNGQVVYVSVLSICKFCERGGTIEGEIIPPE